MSYAAVVEFQVSRYAPVSTRYRQKLLAPVQPAIYRRLGLTPLSMPRPLALVTLAPVMNVRLTGVPVEFHFSMRYAPVPSFADM